MVRMGDKMRSVGIALLGGHSNSTGDYELGIDSIRIVNEEDTKSRAQSPLGLKGRTYEVRSSR